MSTSDNSNENRAIDNKPVQAEEMAEFFNRRAEGYEAHMREDPDFDSFYAGAAEPIPTTDRRIDVLDLGCGTGLELTPLFARVPNARVTCVDLSPVMLGKLKETYRERLSQIEIVEASYVDWKYPDAAYDFVVSVNTMHHFLEPRKVEIYRKILRALKPGGAYVEADFMVSEPMMREYLERYRLAMDSRGDGFTDGTFHLDIPFTVDIQKRLLLKAGFASVRSHLERIRAEHSGAILVANV